MAPLPTTLDYYAILEIEQHTTPELIAKSYKRLALKLHPDRNTKHDATEAFQLVGHLGKLGPPIFSYHKAMPILIIMSHKLGESYEILKDKDKRRAYDLLYPSITKGRHSAQTRQPYFASASTSDSQALRIDTAQLDALLKSKEERAALWRAKKMALDATIFQRQRDIQLLEQEIRKLASIQAAEKAAEAQKNGWTTWMLSAIHNKAEESEEERSHKDRETQERRIEKDMKERRLHVMAATLKTEEAQLRTREEEIRAADLRDDGKIQVIRNRIRSREYRQQQERENEEKERRAKVWREQQERMNRERTMWEKMAQQVAENMARNRAELGARAERERQRVMEEVRRRQTVPSMCIHKGWWEKVQGRIACPECQDIWTYLLQCPSCKMKACPKCQADIRKKRNDRGPSRRQ